MTEAEDDAATPTVRAPEAAQIEEKSCGLIMDYPLVGLCCAHSAYLETEADGDCDILPCQAQVQ